MILLADAGNSRLKWAMFNAGKRSKQFSQDYSKNRADYLLINLLVEKSVSTLIFVSVLGEQLSKKIQHYCEQHNIELVLIYSQSEAYGIKNSYSEPQRLGADRFVGLIAAHHLRPDMHCITISCGTAVTIDAITAEGEHLGGLILPGLQQFSDQLIKNTVLLTSEKTKKVSLFAHNTADALTSGSLFGLVEAINGISSRMKGKLLKINHLKGKQTMSPVQIIICGGDAEIIHQYLSDSVQREDDWLMQGLQVIANIKNEQQA
ncbi:MAG: type III pantothenate kinase [Cocleimonas sp.]|nr:type III pantothenate kinase [Cocleimonas sp.]